MEFFSIQLFIIFLINIIAAWFGLWVYFTNKKNKANLFFLLFTIPIIFWIDFNFAGDIVSSSNLALIFKRLNLASVCIFFIFVYFFSVHFPKISKKRNFLFEKFVVFFWLLLFFCVLFTPLVIRKVELRDWGYDNIIGIGGYVFYAIVFFFTLFIILSLIKKYFILGNQDKKKISYFLIGSCIFFAPFNLVFNVLLPILRGTHQYYQFGDYSTIFLLGFTAYGIAKRELFGMKVVLTTIFVALIAILLALDTFVFTSQTTLQILKGAILIVFLYFGYLMIKSVISEIKRREEVERLSKSKTEFISIASHQLRTPLTAIKGYMSMIIEGTYGKVAENIKRPMENVYKSNERLIRLVNDLLSVSRIESGRIKLKPEKASVESIILIAVQELKNEAEKKGLALKWRKPSKTLPKILIDKDQIRQVILNVVDNAIRYTNKGAVSIEVSCLEKTLLIKISDTGAGMTKEEISYLFESFSRGKAGARLWTEGVGLGLYVAKKFVELHKGKIWAESQGKGKGSSFYIELPLR